ncbi:hypothetical protein SB725_15675 [Pseudomonas sp. SIMBA_041]
MQLLVDVITLGDHATGFRLPASGFRLPASVYVFLGLFVLENIF